MSAPGKNSMQCKHRTRLLGRTVREGANEDSHRGLEGGKA